MGGNNYKQLGKSINDLKIVNKKVRRYIRLYIGVANMEFFDGITYGTEEIDRGKGTTPISKEGRTLVPIRAIIEKMGGTVDWNNEEKKLL